MQTEEPEEKTVDNKLELLKYTSDVQSRIKTDITSDFILAKLNEKDKEAIVELTADAYFSKRVIEQIAKRSHQWHWNNENNKWQKQPLDINKKNKITKMASRIFDSYMIKLQMTALVNRNVDKNYLINILAQQQERNETEDEPVTLAKKPKELILNEEKAE